MGLLRLEHDDQVTQGVCAKCSAPYESVIGVIYEDDEPVAIYRADVYERFHRNPEPRVVLSIAVGDWSDGTDRSDRCSVAIEAWSVGDRVHMAISDRSDSPWEALEVVSWRLTSQAASGNPLGEAFLRLADHVVYDDRRLRKAFSARRREEAL